eukprot:753714_1
MFILSVRKFSKIFQFSFIRYAYSTVAATTSATRCITKLNEHHVNINNTLNAFDNFADVLNNSKSNANKSLTKDLNNFITFFTEYSDKLHHGIEENILFPQIREYGFSVIQCHYGIYLQDEHETNRRYVAMIVDGIENNIIPNNKDVAATIKDFVSFLALHGHKEDNQLYPEIISKTPEESMEIISQQTDKFIEENKQKEDGLLQISSELCVKYGITKKQQQNDSNTFAYFD